MKLLALLLLAAPLSAQLPETITIEPAQVTNIINLDSIALGVTVEYAPRDSAAVARDEAAQRTMDAIAEYLENCGCVNTGPSTVNVIANAGLTLAAFLIAWQLKGIKEKEHPEHPKTEEPKESEDYGEGN